MARLPAELVRAAERAPLYRRLGLPEWDRSHLEIWPFHDAGSLVLHHRGGDAFGGRRDTAGAIDAVVQAGEDLPVYWALGRDDLDRHGRALAGCWQALGVRAGDRVALHDYATSPTVLFTSRAYLAGLSAGAAELLGCATICNDGLAELADRCLHLLRYVEPRWLFVTAESLGPLEGAVRRAGAGPLRCTVVVTADEDPLDGRGLAEWSGRLGTSVTQLLRADAALFLAPPCPADPDTYHPDPSHYLIEIAPSGGLAVTNLGLVASPVIRYCTNLEGRVEDGICACSAGGRRFSLGT